MAVLAFGGVFLLGNTLGGGGGGGSSSKVVVAKVDIPLRHVIVDSDLDYGNVSGNFGAVYTNKADVINKISQITIKAKSVVIGDMLATDINIVPVGATPAYLPLASGFVAMTIPTGELQGVAGHISVGDYITVIASANVTIFSTTTNAPAGPAKIVSKTVFSNLRIIGLGPAIANVTPAGSSSSSGAAPAPTTGVTSSLTVELSQCDAEYFTWFLNNMTLRYTLLSYRDYAKTPPGDNSDPLCPNLTNAIGVNQYTVDRRFKFTAVQ
jgi:Flp pilus assembly protein CpaB